MRKPFSKLLFGGLGILLLSGLAALGFYLKSVADYRQAVREISIQPPPLSQVADGVYVGRWDVGLVAAAVEVKMQGGVIQSVRILEHKNQRGQPAEAVIEEIVTEQRVDVDAVSGATNSSLVLQKAVEQALKQGVSS